MEYEGKEVEQGGPWGYRHQFNIADSGYGPRGPIVHNDRAGEVGRTLSAKDFDLPRIFGREGVQIVHLSGLIAALSPETGAFCLELARAAKAHGTRISFDLNHRASFWKNREQELRDDLRRRSPRSQTSSWAMRRISSCAWGFKVRRRAARTWRHGNRQVQGDDRAGQAGLSRTRRVCHDAARSGQRELSPVGRHHGRRQQTGTSSNRARSPCSTASAAVTASWAACSTPSSGAGSRPSGCSSAGPAAHWSPH